MLFFKTPFVRAATFLFAIIFVGNIVHLVPSGVFVGAVVLFLVAIAIYFAIWRMAPGTVAARDQQATSLNTALDSNLPPGACAVFLLREGSALLPKPAIEASVPGLPPVELRAATSARLILPAGRHILEAHLKGTSVTGENLPATFPFELTPGETLFVLVSTTMDLKRYVVHLVLDPDPSTAKARIARTTLVTS